jgi:hypothetical protein
MTTKNQSIHYALGNVNMAISHLREIKTMDVKNRKKVKPRWKPKYTKAISLETDLINVLVRTKQLMRKIPRRVV